MIRSDSEYRDALRRLDAERMSLVDHESKLKAMGLTPEQIARGMASLRTFHRQFAEKVEDYAKAKRGDFSSLHELRDIGRIIIAGRIALGMSQRAFAKKLGVNESQVSRDERNEYNGITLDRACQILDMLGVTIRVECRLRSHAGRMIQQEFDLSAPSPHPLMNIEFTPVASPSGSSGPGPKVAA